MKQNFAKTKIICTIGPAINSADMLVELSKAGMDVVRLNFSHGTYDEHLNNINNIKSASNILGTPIPILMDLCGPKLRVGVIEDGTYLKEGDTIKITTENIIGNKNIISTNYENLTKDIKPGDMILIDDGLIKLKAIDVSDKIITCEVIYGGQLKSKKGINLPNVNLSIPSITEKDLKDIEFGLKNNVDFIALSFVRHHTDILKLKKIISDKGFTKPIIAKIEKPEAINDIDAIIQESDMVMVARGDLGVEMNTEEVPLLQKMIIEKCNYYAKPVITATQMLESMVNNPRPTRAEASDVANAVLDGTDAVMLSAETSVGLYPLNAVKIMDSIVRKIEGKRRPIKEFMIEQDEKLNLIDRISKGACVLANDIKATAILVITKTGRTARYLSRYRPNTPIIAFTDNLDVLKQMNLVWGVKAERIPGISDTDTTLNETKELAQQLGYIERGDTIVFVAGIPIKESNIINMIKIDKV
ncbi:MAG TPA: pyruvate kinase [Bacteroidota bacterium]|jgi:pyruvate kinase|nr:pyruvate kinase [Bacteroidota bacterium]